MGSVKAVPMPKNFEPLVSLGEPDSPEMAQSHRLRVQS